MDSKIPEELIKNRNVIECNWIFCLFKDINLVGDYKNIVNTEDIITDDGIFYYGLIQGLAKNGYQVADNISIHEYLSSKKTLNKKFEELGGYSTIKEISDLLSLKNLDTYYDELVKNNLLIRLYNAGFNVLKDLNKLNTMSSEEIYDYYDYQLNNISVGKIEKIKVEDLSSGYDEWIKRADSATNIGYRVGSKLLDYQLAGIHKGCLTLYLGGIGQGKSSSSVSLFILPAIEDGNDITILCNEQTADEYRSMIISAVLFGKIGNVKGMNRMSITLGNFDDYKREKLREAADWIEKQPGKIRFVELQNYDIVNVRKIIKQQSKLGCSYFFFDVLKNVNDASDKAWAELSDIAKTLFVLAKNQKVAIIASAQLASDSMNRKYLDLSAVGKSRAISECCATVIGFRPIMNNEVEKIKPWKYKKNPDGSDVKIKEIYDLNPDKHYIMQFIMKNRYGDTSTQIVQEFDQSFNTIKDIGYYRASYDDFKRN